MRIEIGPGVRLFVDLEGAGRVPDGPGLGLERRRAAFGRLGRLRAFLPD